MLAPEPKQDLGELIQIALDVAGSLDPREVIARILERGTHAVQADRATLSSLVGDHIVIEATYGRAGELTWVGQRYSLDYFEGQPLVRKAIETLQPTFGGQLAADRAAPEFREALSSVRHVAVVPLVHGGQAIGMLVFSRYEDRAFTSADLPALTLLGTISGLALRNARLIARAQEAEQAKSEFMSIAVHELRAPLTVASGYLGMAMEGAFGELPPALNDVLATAQRKVEEAKLLADELLAVAPLEGKVLTPKAEPLSVREALQEAVVRARPRAKLVKATIQIEPGDDGTMLADPVMVGKILDNLINNALTYSDHPPTILLQARLDSGHVAITVADDGIGVSLADQPRIFERFARGTDRLSREKPGSGLGLYLSRGLAEQMGGSLRLQASQPGKGSTFVLRLPLAAS